MIGKFGAIIPMTSLFSQVILGGIFHSFFSLRKVNENGGGIVVNELFASVRRRLVASPVEQRKCYSE